MVFLGYYYDFANFHPNILIEAILIKKACITFTFLFSAEKHVSPKDDVLVSVYSIGFYSRR